MRILTGEFRSRLIEMPKGIRPTQQKVRKAVFDILSERVKGAVFLELFAGSGAVGIEAFSNGAEEIVFVENDKKSLKALKNNLVKLGIKNYQIESENALAAIKNFARKGKKFDLIFLDPPYFKGFFKTPAQKSHQPFEKRRVARGRFNVSMAKKALINISGYDILKPNNYVLVEHYKDDKLPESLGTLTLYRKYTYTDTDLSIYKKR